MSSPQPPAADIFAMPVAQLQANVKQAAALLAQVQQLLPGLRELTADNRHSASRFRDGEAAALLPVLDVADKRPELFKALADKDDGVDPSTFEVQLLRDRLQRIAALQPLTAPLEQASRLLSDSVLTLTTSTKTVMLLAYKLVKPQAAHDPSIQTALASAIDFFSAIAKSAAETRAANEAKKKAAAAPPAKG